MPASLADIRENLSSVGTSRWDQVIEGVREGFIEPLIRALFALRGRGFELAAGINRLVAQLEGIEDRRLAMGLVDRLEQVAAQGQRFLRARRAALDAGWSQGTKKLDRRLIEDVKRALLEAAALADKIYKQGDTHKALAVWWRARGLFHDGLWDHLLTTRQESPLWAHLPPQKAAEVRARINKIESSMVDHASVIDGLRYDKLVQDIYDMYRALHDVLDMQEEHQAPAIVFKGAEREDFQIDGVPVVLEYQADAKAKADKARETLEHIVHALHQGAAKSGASWLMQLPPLYVTYAGHPNPRFLSLSLNSLAQGQPGPLLRRLAQEIGERAYDSAPGGPRADWDHLMSSSYWTEFTIQEPANGVEVDRARPRELFSTAVAGLLLKGKSYLHPKVLAAVQALGRSSHMR